MRLSKKIKDQILLLLKENFRIKDVILFGSYSKGEPNKDSDIDIIIILDEEGLNGDYETRLSRRTKVSTLFYEMQRKIPMDILVYTKDEWNKLIDLNSSFIRRIRQTGISLV